MFDPPVNCAFKVTVPPDEHIKALAGFGAIILRTVTLTEALKLLQPEPTSST